MQCAVSCMPSLCQGFHINESEITTVHVYHPYNCLFNANIYPPSDYMHEYSCISLKTLGHFSLKDGRLCLRYIWHGIAEVSMIKARTYSV